MIESISTTRHMEGFQQKCSILNGHDASPQAYHNYV